MPSSNTHHKPLGIRHLGPHAHERRVPSYLHDLLTTSPNPITHGLPNFIPHLHHLLTLSPSTSSATLCHESILFIPKLSYHPFRGEGDNFCGYRNIQTLISGIIAARSRGHEVFEGGVPGIWALQGMIERSWDEGQGEEGKRTRQEVGSLEGTRKWIGTAEARGVLRWAGVPVRARVFVRDGKGDRRKADRRSVPFDELVEFVAGYFDTGDSDNDGNDHVQCGKTVERNERGKVHATTKPPIYLQWHGHSVTIVGLETRTDGSKNLLVFDPAKRPLSTRHKGVEGTKGLGLGFFRKGRLRMRFYRGFEVLFVDDG